MRGTTPRSYGPASETSGAREQMAIFVVMSRSANADLKAKIEQEFPTQYFKFAGNVWFISAATTARKLCEKLGVKKGGITGVAAIQTSPFYYGVANPDLWEWLRSQIEQSSDA